MSEPAQLINDSDQPSPAPTNAKIIEVAARPEALKKNQAFVDLLTRVADEKNATPAQIALAWLLAQRPYVVPIPGTTKLHRLGQSIAAAAVQLTPDDLGKIDTAAAGMSAARGRYTPAQLALAGREAPVLEGSA